MAPPLVSSQLQRNQHARSQKRLIFAKFVWNCDLATQIASTLGDTVRSR